MALFFLTKILDKKIQSTFVNCIDYILEKTIFQLHI
jgi:hypothetical protein